MSTSTTFNISTLPNPITPMAFLPPKLAYESQVALNIVVGTLGVFVWDLLSHMDEDYKILFKHKFTIGTAVYFLSRLTTFLFILASALFRTYPLGNCVRAQTLEMVAFCLSLASTSFLFFLRAAAVYDRNPIFRTFLFTVWLSVLASAILLPVGVRGSNIGITQYCTTGSAKGYIAAIPITPLIHDTCVFLAISWRLLQNSYLEESASAPGLSESSLRGSICRASAVRYLSMGNCFT